MNGERPRHIPVMLAEVLAALAPQAGEMIIDGTIGAGGYTRALLAAADCRVIGLDRDPQAIRNADALAAAYPGRLTLVETPFGELAAVADELLSPAGGSGSGSAPCVDGVVLDIGVSSMQLDDGARGFSFQADGPLDMRMSSGGTSAAEVVNTASSEHLADIIFHLGEERYARRIAKAIVAARAAAPISMTSQLVAIVEKALGRGRPGDRHPATRTFQALRIHVNDELAELVRALVAAERILKPGGRLVVVTFHSLEDRIVKRFLARRTGKSEGASRHGPPQSMPAAAPSFRFVNRQPLIPSQPELDANPRSRSAKLRSAVRTDAPAWSLESGSELGVPMPPGGWRS